MKILLIEPAKPLSAIGGEDVFIFEPLALEYIAAGVLDEHEVKILDLRLDKELKPTLTEFGPDIVGITAYTLHVNVVQKLARANKSLGCQYPYGGRRTPCYHSSRGFYVPLYRSDCHR